MFSDSGIRVATHRQKWITDQQAKGSRLIEIFAIMESSCWGGFMATAEQLKALVRSHVAGDDDRFYSVALQVAAREARSGHSNVAQDLRELVDSAGKRKRRPVGGPVTPVARPKRELADVLLVEYPTERLASLSVEPDISAGLERVLHEVRQSDRLREHGFSPARRLLLVGSPGTGKTMTARALAGELSLPLFTVKLDGLITKFMGETAAKLRLVFDALEETRGVYLFDEVDALAGERSDSNDVGEARRVLNSFLHFLDQDVSDSVIVATSNLPGLLDRALFRRFDLALNYQLPDSDAIRSVIENRLAGIELVEIDWNEISKAAAGLSHAEVTTGAEDAAKQALLADATAVTEEMLREALSRKQNSASLRET